MNYVAIMRKIAKMKYKQHITQLIQELKQLLESFWILRSKRRTRKSYLLPRLDRQTFDINIKIEYYNNTKELTDRRLALLELNVIKNNRPNFAGWGGYFFVVLLPLEPIAYPRPNEVKQT